MAEQTSQNRDNKDLKRLLPFGGSSDDWGEWVYDHRIGLIISIVAYLLLAIVFMSARVSIDQAEKVEGFIVDLQNIPEQKEEIIPDNKRLTEQLSREHFEDVRNLTSNELGKHDAGLKDDRGTDASKVYDEAQAAQDRLSVAREARERGLREANDILASRNRSDKGTSDKAETSKKTGRVTISFSLAGREFIYMHNPAYQCEGGGEVVVAVAVNRNGKVIAANVNNGTSDYCLREMAVSAALQSRFNVDGTAPERQQGTITYIFIPQ